MFRKIIVMSIYLAMTMPSISFTAEYNKRHVVIHIPQEQVQERRHSHKLAVQQQEQDNRTLLKFAAITFIVSLTILSGMEVYDSVSHPHCCKRQGSHNFPKKIDGLHYQEWYSDRDNCPEIRQKLCPQARNRLLVHEFFPGGNYPGYVILDKPAAERKGLIVDAQGYMMNPEKKK